MTVVTIAFCMCVHLCMDWTAWENTVNKYFNSCTLGEQRVMNQQCDCFSQCICMCLSMFDCWASLERLSQSRTTG